jgi:hypothetical protein
MMSLKTIWSFVLIKIFSCSCDLGYNNNKKYLPSHDTFRGKSSKMTKKTSFVSLLSTENGIDMQMYSFPGRAPSYFSVFFSLGAFMILNLFMRYTANLSKDKLTTIEYKISLSYQVNLITLSCVSINPRQ